MKTAKEVIIKEAELVDSQTLLDLLDTVASETEFLTRDSDDKMSHADMQTFITSSLAHPNRLCLLAKVGDEAVGVLNIASQPQVRVNHIGSIFLAVKQAYWGHGLGQVLLEEAIDWAQQSGIIRRLELTVQKRNARAVHIYEKFGFTIEGIQKRGAKTSAGDFLDVYLMSRLID